MNDLWNTVYACVWQHGERLCCLWLGPFKVSFLSQGNPFQTKAQKQSTTMGLAKPWVFLKLIQPLESATCPRMLNLSSFSNITKILRGYLRPCFSRAAHQLQARTLWTSARQCIAKYVSSPSLCNKEITYLTSICPCDSGLLSTPACASGS